MLKPVSLFAALDPSRRRSNANDLHILAFVRRLVPRSPDHDPAPRQDAAAATKKSSGLEAEGSAAHAYSAGRKSRSPSRPRSQRPSVHCVSSLLNNGSSSGSVAACMPSTLSSRRGRPVDALRTPPEPTSSRRLTPPRSKPIPLTSLRERPRTATSLVRSRSRSLGWGSQQHQGR
jgi:hypothetical protein